MRETMKGTVTMDRADIRDAKELVRHLKEEGWLVMVDDSGDGEIVITYIK